MYAALSSFINPFPLARIARHRHIAWHHSRTDFIQFATAAILGIITGSILPYVSGFLVTLLGLAERDEDGDGERDLDASDTSRAESVASLHRIKTEPPPSNERDLPWFDNSPSRRKKRPKGLLSQTI